MCECREERDARGDRDATLPDADGEGGEVGERRSVHSREPREAVARRPAHGRTHREEPEVAEDAVLIVAAMQHELIWVKGAHGQEGRTLPSPITVSAMPARGSGASALSGASTLLHD